MTTPAIPFSAACRRVLRLAIGSVACLLGAGLVVPDARAATYTVTHTGSLGGGSLRQAIADAEANPGPDLIVFDPSLAGQTIQLSHVGDSGNAFSALGVTTEIEIRNTTGSNITIARNASSGYSMRIFNVRTGANLTLVNLTIAGGSLTFWGGGNIASAGTFTARGCTIKGAYVGYNLNPTTSGGGLLVTAGTATLINCTVTGNTCAGGGFGGGVTCNSGASLNVFNCTITGNGGGGVTDLVSSGTTVVRNTILGNNSYTPAGGSGNNMAATLALPSALAANGGPTETMAITTSSPAFGAGIYDSAVLTDQRGIARRNPPDIGAFEAELTPSLTVTTVTDEDDGHSDPGLGTGTSLREALAYAVSLGGSRTITFAPALAGQTVELSQTGYTNGDDTALYAIGTNTKPLSLTIQGLTGGPGVTIARAAATPQLRLFWFDFSQLTVTLNDLTLSGGLANAGGAMFIRGAQVTLNRCTLSGNTANFGGAICKDELESNLYVNNTTLANNHATIRGGGIYNVKGASEFWHVTITGNSAESSGGAAFFSYGFSPRMMNCIIAGNSAPKFPEIDGILIHSSNNLCSDPGTFPSLPSYPNNGAGGMTDGMDGNILGVNAYLGTLANNGGPTATVRFTGPSPAIDRGAVLTGFSEDQRGVARPQGSAPDIGAFEAQPAAPVIFSGNTTTFTTLRENSFRFTATGSPLANYSATGTLPAGVTLGTDGLLGGTPALFTEGTYPITVTADNGVAPAASQNFTLVVEKGDFVVTTAVDEDDGSIDPGLGTGTSLREAMNHATARSGPQTITFSSALAGQTIELTTAGDNSYGSSAFLIDSADITIQGLTGEKGITLWRASTAPGMRLFLVRSRAAKLTLNDVTVANGSANYGGGVFNAGEFYANRCTFKDNYASSNGGAIANVTSAETPIAGLVNCTIVNNSCFAAAGGIYSDSTLSMLNCTVFGNFNVFQFSTLNAGLEGSGTLTNCIVAENVRAFTSYENVSSGFTGANNLIGFGGTGSFTDGVDGNIVGVGNIGTGTLTSVGGPTEVIPLLKSSPARNAGSNAAAPATDQRGVARPQGGTADIGAYEYVPFYQVTTTADEDNNSSDPGVGAGTSLREALRDAAASGTAQSITFAPALAGQTVNLASGWNDGSDTTALRISTPVTVQGPDTGPGITLKMQNGVQRRHFYVEASGSLTLSNLTLRDGHVADFGGSVWNFGSLTVLGCTFTGNHAGAEGGAIQSWGDSPSLFIESSTFTGNNSGGIGSAMDIGSLSMTLRHVTITDNAAANARGAVTVWKNRVTLVNSIVAGNTDGSLGSVNGGGFSAGSVNNLVGTGGAGGLVNGVNGNLVGIPASALYLGSLANNGGPTPTVAPLPGSPAINSGTGVVGLTKDQRGLARVVGSAPDIGAVEDSVGDDDADDDTLHNLQELSLGTNPASIDTDDDGFNDATEILSGSDPTLAGSVPGTTRVERVLGFGVARGLDLSGNFAYAFNVGTTGAAGKAGDANFTADNATGIAVSAPNQIANWAVRSFGNGADNDVLETVFRSIRWANFGHSNPDLRTLKVDLANLVPGWHYKLQLLFAENGATARTFDVSVQGTLIVDDFVTATAQGGATSALAAAAIVHEFTATGNTLHIELSGADVAVVSGLDRNPILNGLTLESAEAPPVAGTDTLNRPATGRVTKVLLDELLQNDSDVDGGALSISAVGNPEPEGATVTLVGNFAVYTAPVSNAGNGSFTYTLNDGTGGQTTGTVHVIESSSGPGESAPNSASLSAAGADIELRFLGVPGRTYGVQYTTDSSPPYTWMEFGSPVILVAPASGILGYTDVSPADPMRLYRAVLRP